VTRRAENRSKSPWAEKGFLGRGQQAASLPARGFGERRKLSQRGSGWGLNGKCIWKHWEPRKRIQWCKCRL